MKSIELTKDHRSKLLEMCKELFPEYRYFNLTDGNCDLCTIDTLLISKDEKPKHNSWLMIHWFEFCMRYLVSKLDRLYFENVMNPIDPFDKRNYVKGNKIIYPDNWKELWDRRPFLQWNSNNNGTHYKKHPIDYLYEEFKKLKQ